MCSPVNLYWMENYILWNDIKFAKLFDYTKTHLWLAVNGLEFWPRKEYEDTTDTDTSTHKGTFWIEKQLPMRSVEKRHASDNTFTKTAA